MEFDGFYPESFLIPLLYYFVLLCKSFKDQSPRRGTFRFIGKADAKVRSFSYILQIFGELFLKKFSEAFFQEVTKPRTAPSDNPVIL